MQYEKQVIDVHNFAYDLDPNNIYDPVGIDLNKINRFFVRHITTQSDNKGPEIQKRSIISSFALIV